MAILGQDRAVVWLQERGPFTPWSPFVVGDKAAGMSGKSLPAPGRTPVYGRDRFGKPVLVKMNSEAPGELPTATITFYEDGSVDVLRRALLRGCPINIQNRLVDCGVLNNPNVWSTIDHYGGGQPTSYTPGDGPSVEYNGEQMTNEVAMAFTHVIRLVQTTLSDLTSGTSLDVLDIDGIPDEDCGICGTGFPGADQILIVGLASDTGATGEVLVTGNGGGSWAATSTNPFGASTDEEDISSVAVNAISKSGIRYVVATNTAVNGEKARIAYADVDLSDLLTTTWNVITLDNTTVTTSSVTALGWLKFNSLYIAAEGDIYVSEDQGGSDPGAPVYTGSTAITGFAISPDENTVWAFGESNLLLREVGDSRVFEARVGPSGGGTFTAIAIAGDGTLFAGNGTSIYRSTDQAGGTANWTALKDFGTGKPVVAIQVIGGQRAGGGDSQLLRVVVDNGSGAGEVWMSVDGGLTWFQPATRTNAGYNAAYASEIDDNLLFVVGDASGGAGVIQRLSA